MHRDRRIDAESCLAKASGELLLRSHTQCRPKACLLPVCYIMRAVAVSIKRSSPVRCVLFAYRPPLKRSCGLISPVFSSRYRSLSIPLENFKVSEASSFVPDTSHEEAIVAPWWSIRESGYKMMEGREK